jgi:hypothetical protein
MNHQIRILAEQATSIVESPPNREGLTSSYAYFDKEKFAELIVLECAVIVGSMEEPHQDIAKLIKQHFGVEE